LGSATILAVDPGASSGWAILTGMKVADWGVVRLGNVNAPDEMRMVGSQAVRLGARTMIIEGPFPFTPPHAKDLEEDDKVRIGWRTGYSLGVSRGRWEQTALLVGLGVEEVNPRTWQAATVGTGRREQQIAKYRDRAASMAKVSAKEIPADAAAAICIGDWWMVRERIQPPWKKGGFRLKP